MRLPVLLSGGNLPKQKHGRHRHIEENAPIVEAPFADWVKQAAALPGEKM